MPPSREPPAVDEAIVIKGARAHNLKNVDVTLPRDKFVVITGPSGSGKSSLAFDTIYAEGQRRYVESLSVYARQFLDQLSKPEVESITGLSPTISIEQRTTSYNPRSTVGTVTEVYDYLRLLFSRISKPFCYQCGNPIQSQSQEQMVDTVLGYPEGTKISLLAPVVRGRKGEYQKELAQLRTRGFVRVRIDGALYDLSDEITLDRNKKHEVEVYVDRLVIKDDQAALRTRISDSVELALRLSSGLLLLEVQEPDGKNKSEKHKKDVLLSQKFACLNCGISYPEPEPRTFSFNSPVGACPKCDGLGIIPAEEQLDLDSDEPTLLPPDEPCPLCLGARLDKESLFFKIKDKNIVDVASLSIVALKEWVKNLELTKREAMVGARILKEIGERLDFMIRVGVGYLSLSRSAQSLSGGEAQRIRLATQIGSSLVGVVYVLDEPSIGLHPKDHRLLLDTLRRLRDLGNTVLVVEHDSETIGAADWVVDLGPGAGTRGGEIVAFGTVKQITANPKSLTGKYLKGTLSIPTPKTRRLISKDKMIRLSGIDYNNLKNISVDFPLETLICVTGVSGSGKSSLILDTLYPLLFQKIYHSNVLRAKVGSVTGLEHIDKVVDIDQSPIGKTPRSNPATYTGLFSMIRDLFAMLPDAQVRGYKPGRFSFNVKGGRCDACEGDGVTRVVMHFLPDVFVTCERCKGRRYNRETLEIRFKGKNIADVLEMTAEEALEFFDAVPQLKSKLTVINDVGLGYIQLGQSATTLSGGEAQRMKLSKELSRRATGKTLYILDEPTTGLHLDDVKKLLEILQQLVNQGNTVIVIEHQLDFIKVADYVIDLGPEGGEAGGQIIAAGTPEEIAKNSGSYTGKFLRGVL